MMDHDELVPYEGEYVQLDTLDCDQINSLIVSLESEKAVNEYHKAYVDTMTANLRDELRERGWRPEGDVDTPEYMSDGGVWR